MDWDYIVLALFIAGTIAAFFWRRTRNQVLYYLWLGLMWVEVEVRKLRDRKGGKRGI